MRANYEVEHIRHCRAEMFTSDVGLKDYEG